LASRAPSAPNPAALAIPKAQATSFWMRWVTCPSPPGQDPRVLEEKLREGGQSSRWRCG
jgi:hypothetical protein